MSPARDILSPGRAACYRPASWFHNGSDPAIKIDLQPDIEALLRQQVDAGAFKTIEDALAAAVRVTYLDDDGLGDEGTADPIEDLSWAKPYPAEADADIEAGRTRSHAEVWADLEKRFGKV